MSRNDKPQKVVVTGNYNEVPLRVFLYRFATGQFLAGPKPPIAPTHWERKTRVQRAIWRWGTLAVLAGWGVFYEYNHLVCIIVTLAVVPYLIHHGTMNVLKKMERPQNIVLSHHVADTPTPTLDLSEADTEELQDSVNGSRRRGRPKEEKIEVDPW